MPNICTIVPEEDCKTILNNPYMGWVAYVEYSCMMHLAKEHDLDMLGCLDANDPCAFFTKLDREIEKGLRPSILYLRLGWSIFEPEKGEYSWRNPDSLISKYIQGALDRRMQLSFRVLLADDYHGEDEPASFEYQCHTVPAWLFEEPGFDFYVNAEDNLTPYYDNETYLHHYEQLIKELGKDFDNPNLLAFADAQGLGYWGEMHGIETSGRWSIEKTIEEHAKIWTKYFKNILLGATFGGGAEVVNRDVIVPKYQHMVRRDGYGSRWITREFEETYLNDFFPQKISSYAEVCYWHLGDYAYIEEHFNLEPELDFTGNREKDLRQYLELCISQAQYLRANTLDARIPGDWNIWTELGKDLIDKFSIENGYRLVPTEFKVPEQLQSDTEITLEHSWKNTALGFMPIVNNQLKDKYKISFALFDDNDEMVYQYVDLETEPSWVKEEGLVKVTSKFTLPADLPKGPLKLAVAIVDRANNNIPGINLASKMPTISIDSDAWYGAWYGAWYIVDTVEVI